MARYKEKHLIPARSQKSKDQIGCRKQGGGGHSRQEGLTGKGQGA